MNVSQSNKNTPDRYATLLEVASKDINKADFAAIREAYTQSPGYAPYAPPIAIDELREALQAQDWARAGYIAAELLKVDFLQTEIHGALAQVFEQGGRQDVAAWHRAFANGLVNALMNSGDGFSFETAIKVVNVREEYEVLSLLDLSVVDRRLVLYKDRHYDVFLVRDAKGQQATIHFDVEVMIGAAIPTAR
jgi:hypothetical protein